jgi:hypothetical protein
MAVGRSRESPAPVPAFQAGVSWKPRRERAEPKARAPHTVKGWPPLALGATDIRQIDTVSSGRYFSFLDQRISLQAALAHPDVQDLLHGRWEVLGCDLVCERGMPRHVRQRVRVYLFNYTSNHLVEVSVEDEHVVSVTLRASHEYPEAPIEMAQAIALARAAPELRDKAKTMAAHAILQVPDDPHGPSYAHRCILVMFTENDDPHRELPVQYSAMVDL